MKKALAIFALLLGAATGAYSGEWNGSGSTSGGITNGSDFNGDDIVAKTLTSTGTAPSLTATGGVFTASLTVIGTVTINQGGINAVPALTLSNVGTNNSALTISYGSNGEADFGRLPSLNGGDPVQILTTNRSLSLMCNNNAYDASAGCVNIEQVGGLTTPRATLVVRQASGFTTDPTQWMSSDGVVRASMTPNFNLNLGYGVQAASGTFTSGVTAASATVLGTLSLTSGQAVMGAPTFQSTVTVSGTTGIRLQLGSNVGFNQDPPLQQSLGGTYNNIVAGNALKSKLVVYYDGTSAAGIGFSSVGGLTQLEYNVDGGFDHAWYGSGNERMRLTNAGSLGIGTASPGAKLDVAGNAQFGSGVNKATVTAGGFWQPLSQTTLQASLLAPTSLGQYIQNATTNELCKSTGTSAGNWQKVDGGGGCF